MPRSPGKKLSSSPAVRVKSAKSGSVASVSAAAATNWATSGRSGSSSSSSRASTSRSAAGSPDRSGSTSRSRSGTSSCANKAYVSAGARKPHNASTGVSAIIISGFGQSSANTRSGDPSASPVAVSRAKPASSLGPGRMRLQRQRLGGGEHLEQVRQPGPELRHARRTDHPGRIRVDQLVQRRLTHLRRSRRVSAEPQFRLRFAVRLSAQELGQYRRRPPGVPLDGAGHRFHGRKLAGKMAIG